MEELRQGPNPLIVDEYINGELIEMPGEKDSHNKIAGAVLSALRTSLRPKGFQVYAFDLKPGVPDKQNFFIRSCL